MLFPTFDFLVFVVPVMLVCWALAHRPWPRTVFLLAASYFFYVAGPKTDPPSTPGYFAFLLVFSTVLDYVCAGQIHRFAPDLASADPARVRKAQHVRRFFLGASLVGNLGMLGYFKYTDFFVKVGSDLGRALGYDIPPIVIDVVLPVGISFYTFQSLSYTLDVWRGQLTPEPSFLKFALFVTFFPQLVAGPIVRASEFLPQLHRRLKLHPRFMDEGLFRVFKGLFKKVVLGDWVAAQLTDAVFASPENYTALEILIALYAFTLQLYADFSGYSDIAIGIARMLGFELPENFDRPHQARNIGEFWRRWHMTLSTWLRDYLFFPLGGSRGTPARVYFNLWATMFLVGMWHYSPGTSWNFVIYANLQAGAILFNRWNKIRKRTGSLLRRGATILGLACGTAAALGALGTWALDLNAMQTGVLMAIACLAFFVVTWLPTTDHPLNVALHIVLTFHFTVITRIFFRAESFDVAQRMLSGLLTFDGHGMRPGFVSPWVWAALLFGVVYHYTPKAWVDVELFGWFRRIPGPVLGVLLALFSLGLMKLMEGTPRAFIYFQF